MRGHLQEMVIGSRGICFPGRTRMSCVRVRCEAYPRVASLRSALSRPGLLLGPCCHDGLSAKLIEKAGFPYTFMSGFTTSAAKLAAPDVGYLTYSEMVQKGRDVHEATQFIPVIGDGDTGYGNALNVKRTVKGYADAGFAGILIEDQVWPKSCGHVRSKKVVSRVEAVERIVAAVEARDTSNDIAILARTDARQAESFEEALFRIEAFANAGADILFIDALESVEEMERFCSLLPSVPKLANMLEGGGKTPILTPKQLEDIGFKLAAYPLSLLGVSINAMQQALEGLRNGQVPDLNFHDIQETLGFENYFAERKRYSVKAEQLLERLSLEFESSGTRSPEDTPVDSPSKQNGASASMPLEADVVLPPEAEEEAEGRVMVAVDSSSEDQEETNTTREEQTEGKKEEWFPTFARVRVTNTVNQNVTMDFKIPVGFLNDVSGFIPAMKDVDLGSFVTRERFPEGQPAFQFTEDNSLVEVFLE